MGRGHSNNAGEQRPCLRAVFRHCPEEKCGNWDATPGKQLLFGFHSALLLACKHPLLQALRGAYLEQCSKPKHAPLPPSMVEAAGPAREGLSQLRQRRIIDASLGS